MFITKLNMSQHVQVQPQHFNMASTHVLPAPRSYQLPIDNRGKYSRNRRDIRSIPQAPPKRVTTQQNVSA